MNKIAVINISFLTPKTISCVVTYQDSILNSDTYTSDSEDISLRAFFLWLCATINGVFYLPASTEITFRFNESPDCPQILDSTINKLNRVIANTQFQLKKIHKQKNIAITHNGKLFLNLGMTPYLYQLYLKAYEECPAGSFHDPCHVINKDPEGESLPTPSVEDFVENILKNKLRTIYSHNVSYLSYFMEVHEVYLFCIADYIGVEFIIVDFDTYNQMDGQYYHKLFMNNENHRRYCVMPHEEKYWDQTLKISNARYFTFPYKISEQKEIIRNDYDIVISTWSRLDKIFCIFKSVLTFLDFVDPEKPFYDFQMLYRSLSHLLLNQTSYSTYEKMLYNKIFSMIFYQSYSFLKFEIIEALKDIRNNKRIFLFGDNIWEKFYPKLYRRPLNLDEIKDFRNINIGRPFIYLLMNPNYNYLETNPMMTRVLNAGFPYLNISSVLRLNEHEGLNVLEYDSKNMLLEKIDNIETLIQDDQYQRALKNLIHDNNKIVDDFFDDALHGQAIEKTPFFFEELTQRHEELFLEKLIQYLKVNGPKVQECMTKLISRDFSNYDLYQSRYAERPFMKKMIEFYMQEKSNIPDINFEKLL
ncbi:MAG: hypothetical protein IPJ69_03190 [Deltaproteobacteria bacterium]|nr:MAG: hypothetical protein IPJ69_03190 [Deltaproteobacteria bacterium]